ncbi:MAG: hypothetical protein R6U68_09640 [Desulfobacteraceae bacterium]
MVIAEIRILHNLQEIPVCLIALTNQPEIKSWFFRLKPKKEQNFQRLMDQIKGAGTSLFGTKAVQVKPELTALKAHGSKTALCTSCGEAFKVVEGPVCPACPGNRQYIE